MILIVDASAVINNFVEKYPEDRLITSPRVINELGEKRDDIKKLEEQNPKQVFLKIVKDKNIKLNDNVSLPDMELLALSLEFNAPIVTDDYGIQNLAKDLNIKFIPVAQEGIKKVLVWEYYCSGCRKKYNRTGVCDICGSKIKRRASRSVQ
jgi:UPF0271 protein